jgi:two-component system OmpR family sensor kinase
VTLRARLTLWYTAVLAAILLLFGTLVYLALSYSLTSQIEQTLIRTADDILRASSMPEDLQITLRALDLTTNVYVQVWDAEGNLRWQSGNASHIQEPFEPTAWGVRENIFTRNTVGMENLRVLTVPLITQSDDELVGYLQLGRSLETVDMARNTLLGFLMVGGVAAIAVAAVIGYMAAGAALRPLDQVTETAEQITRADDLSRRIPLSGVPSGEVSRLIVAFNETLERLEALFETQRRFLADVSHELRTPLTAIRGNVDLIEKTGEADPISLEAISSEVDRMTRMVRDLLLLAQAETGKLPLAQDVVELDTLVLEVYQQAKILARDGVYVRLGREDQARVIGDRDRLKQVVLNLAANAVEHTPEGGTVTMEIACDDKWVNLIVSDTGPGIPEAELPNIFERFYRLDPSRKRTATGGTGLGLSIAFWITRSHGGTIDVSSTVGEGSTFVVRLPRLLDETQPSVRREFVAATLEGKSIPR